MKFFTSLIGLTENNWVLICFLNINNTKSTVMLD